ncbi:hypothetical protein [Paraburkholderia sp. UCT2]|uniref:hypothetical protein n=1 Tax=unclassified Paraburkholderia TaxID=2615204 RepID=UPI00165640FF|nr:hypothetical protein [Paraburkholderia sp. UCT2]MBC8730019.1 hypothetical protein [Paraburkholderia sp. UCT2]
MNVISFAPYLERRRQSGGGVAQQVPLPSKNRRPLGRIVIEFGHDEHHRVYRTGQYCANDALTRYALVEALSYYVKLDPDLAD